jgi:hypothetical protein
MRKSARLVGIGVKVLVSVDSVAVKIRVGISKQMELGSSWPGRDLLAAIMAKVYVGGVRVFAHGPLVL